MGVSTTTTYFVGGHYEVANGVVTKYYFAGSQRIAMRQNGTLNYLLGDHLGSTSLTTDANGIVISEMRYKAWGETRYASGTTPTKYTYTGQYSYVSDFGLHFYNARWYDSSLSRFAQADTVVTGGVQGLDRYAYTSNSPINYVDPTGNMHLCGAQIPEEDCQAGVLPASMNNGNQNSQNNQNGNIVVIVFCGSNPGAGISSANPNCPGQVPAWQTNPNNYSMNFVPYPGSKYQQAKDAEGLALDVTVILICYSAGTESCLMYAKSRVTQNQMVQSVVLLGSTFTGKNEMGNELVFGESGGETNGDWASYIDTLLANDVDVLVVNDEVFDFSDPTNGYKPGETATGDYEYWRKWMPHYDAGGWIKWGTNQSESLKNDVYNWISDQAVK